MNRLGLSNILFPLTLLFSPAMFSQFSGQSTVIQGEVTQDGAISYNNFMVELVDESTHMRVGRVSPQASGTFLFNDVKPGAYRLRVTTISGDGLVEQSVYTGAGERLISLKLPPSEQKPTSTQRIVTLRALLHPPSAKVIKQMRESYSLMERGEADKAQLHIEKAIALDPEFSGARRALALLHVQHRELEKAVAEFQEAIRLDPADSPSLVDLGTLYLQRNRPIEAEEFARRAIKADRSFRKARFLLGMALVRQQRELTDAVRELKEAESEFPAARLGAAEGLVHLGNYQAARDELKEYLANESAPQRVAASAWLARLTSLKQ